MIIYKDICSGDEVLTDAYKIETEDEDFLLKVEGKMTQVKKGGGISADLIGGNPSQEEGGDEDVDDAQEVQSGIDVVINNNLKDQSEFFESKKMLTTYLKKWAKNTAAALQEKDETKCGEFKKCCQAKLKNFIDKWSDDASVFSGETFDLQEGNSGLLIGVWTPDGMGITLYAIKLGLEEEKM